MPDPMTDARLDEISALADAATPGPWVQMPNGITVADEFQRPAPGDVSYRIVATAGDCAMYGEPGFDEAKAIAAFVAAARTAVPELVAEVRRARAAEAEARAELAHLRRKVTGGGEMVKALAAWLRAEPAKEA